MAIPNCRCPPTARFRPKRPGSSSIGCGAGPPTRAYLSLTYDPVRQRAVMFGGQAPSGAALGEMIRRPSPIVETAADE